MRLFLLVALTMTAFAANSLLNRVALADGHIGPGAFAAIRLGAGALMLAILLGVRSGGFVRPGRPGLLPIAGLAAYMLGFSYAYVALDAGLGALILFGGVQITMFLGALRSGELIPWQRWMGAVLAFGGLVFLLAPGATDAPPLFSAALMLIAAIGWGLYSLAGRGVADPLRATAENFLYVVPLALGAVALWPDEQGISPTGILLAVVSGAVTSGLGYALWYSLLPRIGASVAAVAQLSAPVIAILGGVVFLGEVVSLRTALAAALVLGGVALGVIKR